MAAVPELLQQQEEDRSKNQRRGTLALVQAPVPSGLGERISGDPGMFILKLPSASW
uniref:Sorting nexin 5 n=1 Tax=Colobus angolensis palliatus TaxID=336983 RepID=A0A2K5I5I3_COLAP